MAKGTLGANHVSRAPASRGAQDDRDAERCVIASSTHPTGLRPSLRGPGPARPSLELNQGDPPCSSPPWPPGPRQGWAACSDRFWLLELRVSQHFSTFYEPSVQSMDTQLNALPTLPVLARTVSGCLNSGFLDFSQHFAAICSGHGYPTQRAASTSCPRFGPFLGA